MFNELLGTMMPESSWMTPEMGSLMAANPEAAAAHLAAQGVPPPPAGGGQQMPAYNPLEGQNLASFMPPAQPQQVASQAAPMMPTAPQMGAPTGNDPLSAAAPQATGTNPVGGLAKALSGLKAPANPETQKITSPRLPQQSAIPSGSPIAALLAKAVAGDPTAMLTLRAAIGGGR